MGLSNNDILKKLRVAHKLRDTDIVEICGLVDFKVATLLTVFFTDVVGNIICFNSKFLQMLQLD